MYVHYLPLIHVGLHHPRVHTTVAHPRKSYCDCMRSRRTVIIGHSATPTNVVYLAHSSVPCHIDDGTRNRSH